MALYYAITQRYGQWWYVCSGSDPRHLLQEARALLESQEGYPDEEAAAISPGLQRDVEHLRIIPAELARTQFRILYPRH